MGSLPALYVNPPQDPSQGLQRAITLRSLLQNQPLELQQRQQAVQSGALQLQQQQQQVKDQQAMTAAWKSWDGKSPDSLIQGVLANGGSGAAANQLEQQMLARQQQHMQLDEGQMQLQQKHTDRMLGRFDAAENVSDDKLAGHVKDAIDESVSAGDMDQRQALVGYQLLQQSGNDPKALRDGLDAFRKGHMLDSQIAARAKEQSETQKNVSEANEAQQTADFYKQHPELGAPKVPAETVSMMDYMRTPAAQGEPPHTPANFPAWKAKQEGIQTAPQKLALASEEGKSRATIEHDFATAGNAALANVPTRLVAPATAAADKADQDYAQAKSVSDRIAQIVAEARAGNKVAYQILPQEGALQVTTSQGVHRINMAEIQNYGGGSLWDSIKGKAGKILSGESIPSNILDDMEKMQSLMARGSQEKYSNSLKSINSRYGSTFQGVEMGGMPKAETRTYQGHTYEKQADGSWKLSQ